VSHNTKHKTLVKDVNALLEAARRLGIPLLEGCKVQKVFYKQNETKEDRVKGGVKADYVFAHDRRDFGVALRKTDDGSYEFMWDACMGERTLLLKFGKSMVEYKTQRVSYGDGSLHVPTGAPTRFLQEYVAVVTEREGLKAGYAVEDNHEEGRRVLYLRGGELTPEQYIEVVANEDGTSEMSIHGIKGEACMYLGVTKVLSAVLGTVTNQTLNDDYYHYEVNGETQHGRGRQ
jgi:hypothetical protein